MVVYNICDLSRTRTSLIYKSNIVIAIVIIKVGSMSFKYDKNLPKELSCCIMSIGFDAQSYENNNLEIIA